MLSSILNTLFPRLSHREAMRRAELYKRRTFSGMVAALAAMVPAGLLHFTTPSMTGPEKAFVAIIMISAMLIAALAGEKNLLLGMLAIPLCIFSLSFAGFYAFHLAREAKIAPLRARLDEYLALTLVSNKRETRPEAGQVRLPRKLVAVDVGGRVIDPLQILLPKDLRAAKPDEVRTVLLLNWGEEPEGKYARGGTAFRRFCDVSAIELSQPPKVIYRRRFVGGDPPNSSGSSNLYGRPPIDEILSFLKETVE